MLWGGVAFFVPFQLHYNYVLNIFYHFGAPFADAGLFAHIAWRNGWDLRPSWPYGDYPFYVLHFSPFFLLVNALSFLVAGMHMAEFFAAFMAAVYSSLGLSLFVAFRCITKPRNSWQIAGLALVAMAFSFNGSVMRGVWMPHYEYAIPAGIFLFLVCFARRWWLASGVLFVLTLSLREDVGFHLASFLGWLTLARYRETRRLGAVKREIGVIVVAVLYGLFAFWAKAYEGQITHFYMNNFKVMYAGTPAYAHVTWDLLRRRLLTMATFHADLWVGAVITIAWAFRTRDVLLVAGFVACVPWFLFHLTAANPDTGIMHSWYTFPFVVSLVWPVLVIVWRHPTDAPLDVVGRTLKLQALLLLVSLFTWNNDAPHLRFGPRDRDPGGRYVLQQGAQNRSLVHDFVAKFDAGAAGLGSVVRADGGILSLVSPSYRGKLVLSTNNRDRDADTVILMNSSRDTMRRFPIPGDFYCVSGTTICLFTNRSPTQLGVYSGLLERVP